MDGNDLRKARSTVVQGLDVTSHASVPEPLAAFILKHGLAAIRVWLEDGGVVEIPLFAIVGTMPDEFVSGQRRADLRKVAVELERRAAGLRADLDVVPRPAGK